MPLFTSSSNTGSCTSTGSSSGTGSSSSNSEFGPYCHLRLLDEETRILFPEALPLAATEVLTTATSSTTSSSSEYETWYLALHGILGGRRNLRSYVAGLAKAMQTEEPARNNTTSSTNSRSSSTSRSRAFTFDLRGHGCSSRGPISVHLMARDLYAQLYQLLKETAEQRGIPLPSSTTSNGSSSSSSSSSTLPHWEGMRRVAGLLDLLQIRLVLIGHSFGALVCMQAALDAAELPLFAATVILDISPSPYLLNPDHLSPDSPAKETTTIFLPNSGSINSSSSNSSRILCCLDVGRRVPRPKEGVYASSALIDLLLDLPLPLFASRAAVALALQQVQPPIKPAVINWLLLSLSSRSTREKELLHLLRQQTRFSQGDRQGQGVYLPSEQQQQQQHYPQPPRQPQMQPQEQPQLEQQPQEQQEQQKQEHDDGDGLCWHLDLPALHALTATNRSFGLAAAPLSIHDPSLPAAVAARGVYRHPILFVRGSKSPWLNFELQQQSIYRHFPLAQLQTIQDAGHWLHAQQPQATIRVAADFLRETAFKTHK
ncbi:hydrolase, alpha/beta fold family domain-containing protein, putative [Eimeria maxima]|uniref:Hydrolase, alpha/beta fold family domain-containing protein, putative n=1 Tax=Eimeria maxima TaxID=5804 RepID=U6LWC8_EIMMA|nr:hydrolase, alpha/beta fold family domain-containing protein, putative [Eimeria maxima]CDJ56267.1 hydrolase, alpha/beta fold family domain-containing protein, putative [Eimeria maxima]